MALLPLTSSDAMSNVAFMDRTDAKKDSHPDCCCGVIPEWTRRTSPTSRVAMARAYAAMTAAIAEREFSAVGSAGLTSGLAAGGAATGGAATGTGAVMGATGTV